MLISYPAMPSSLKRSRSPDDSFAPRVKRLSVNPCEANSPEIQIGPTERSRENKLHDRTHFVKLQELHSLSKKRKFGDIEERCSQSHDFSTVCVTSGREETARTFLTPTHTSQELLISKSQTICQYGAVSERTLAFEPRVEYHRHKRKRYNNPEDSKMADVDASFNSFNYWKPVLPEIDDDLMSLMGNSFEMETDSSLDFGENTDFNSFNFWRAPIPTLDMEIDFGNL